MTLTTHIHRETVALFIGTADEIPGLAYRGKTEAEVRDRLQILGKALSSPNIRLVSVDEDGNGVVLTLDRKLSLDLEQDCDLFPRRRAPFSLEEAFELLS